MPPRLSSIATAIILTFLTQFFLASCNNNPLVIQTSGGTLRGAFTGRTRLGREIREFKGIPFAEPPVGDLRYEPPQPPKSWTGIRDATFFGSQCLQETGGSEDCLYLNVYTPPANIAKKLPVIVYIHGGFFKTGSSHLFRPDYLLDEDVILVTIQYRLHSLGFLNTADGLIKGNMGLKDQIAALAWVRNNIGNFGGDPSRVTIMGESAGAASVSYLLLSPLARGKGVTETVMDECFGSGGTPSKTYRGAIGHSGTAIKVWSYQPRPAEQARLLAQRLNCPTNSSTAMVDCLKKANGADIVRFSTIGGSIKEDLNVFCPSVEVEEDGAAISKHPYDILVSGEGTRVPWLTGVNSAEGILTTIPITLNLSLVHQINQNWSSLAPQFLQYDYKRTDITSKITQFYLRTEEQINFLRQFDNFTAMFSDRLYISFTRKAAKIQSQFSPVYIYYNNHMLLPGHDHGVSHAADLPLFFPLLPIIGPSSRHFNISSSLIKLWTQFASGSDNLQLNEVEWQPVKSDKEGVPYLNITESDIEMVQDPVKERMCLWDEIDLYRVEPVVTKE